MGVKLVFLTSLLTIILLLPVVNADYPGEIIQFTLLDGITSRENNIFAQNSFLEVYVYTPIQYNYNRIVAIDYLFLVVDPNENPVHIIKLENRSRSYTKESSVHFKKLIPYEWIDGEYTLKIYIIDRMNPKYATSRLVTSIDPRMSDSKVSDLDKFFSTTNEGILINEGLMKERSDSPVIEKKIEFIIDSSARPYFIKSITVPKSVPPDSVVNAVISVENTISTGIKDEIFPKLNGKNIDMVEITLGTFETKNITVAILDSEPGTNILEIGSKNASYDVEKYPKQPTRFIYSDLTTDKVKLLAGEEFNVSIRVFNAGENGSNPVYLLLNDQVEAVKNVTLEYGGSEVVFFNVSKNNPGIYQARIKDTDFMKIILIQEKDGSNLVISDENKQEFLIPFILVSVAILSIFLLYRRFRKSGKTVKK